MPLHKPQRWAPVGAGLVAPEWRGLWRGLVIAYPMWEGGGLVLHNVAQPINNTDGSAGDPSWEGSQFGLVINFDGDDSITLSNFTPPAQGTVFFIAVLDDFTATRRPFGSSDRFESTFGSGDKNITNDCWQAGSVNTASKDNAIVAGRWYKVGLTWDSNSGVDTTQRIYLDGKELSSYERRALANDDPGTATLSIGKRTGSDFFVGREACWYLWDRILNDGEHLQLAHDPFGLLRMWRPTSAAVVAAAAAPIPDRVFQVERAIGRSSLF